MGFIVTEASQRPAGKDGECFYCKQKVGETHLETCVLVKKTVKVRMTAEYEVQVPAHWDAYQVEFHRNEGSWCCDNAIGELEKLAEEKGCLCNVITFECLSSDGQAFLGEC